MFQSYLGFTERIWHVGCEKLRKKPHQSTCLETHGRTLLTKNWLNKHVLGWKLIHDLNLLSWKGWKSWVSIIPNMLVVNHNFGSECSANANALNQEAHRELKLNLMMEVLCIYSNKVSIKCCSKRLSWVHSVARLLWQSGWQSWFSRLGSSHRVPNAPIGAFRSERLTKPHHCWKAPCWQQPRSVAACVMLRPHLTCSCVSKQWRRFQTHSIMIIVDINSIYWECFSSAMTTRSNQQTQCPWHPTSIREGIPPANKNLSWDLNQQSIKASNSAPGTPQSLGRRTANCLGRQLACVSQRLHTRVENLRLWHVWSCYPTYLEGTFFFQNEEVGRTILCVETMMFIMPVVISQGRRRKHASWSQSTPSAGHPQKKTDIPLPNAITPHWTRDFRDQLTECHVWTICSFHQDKALDSSISISPSLTGQWLLATAVGFLRLHLLKKDQQIHGSQQTSTPKGNSHLHEQLERPPWGVVGRIARGN